MFFCLFSPLHWWESWYQNWKFALLITTAQLATENLFSGLNSIFGDGSHIGNLCGNPEKVCWTKILNFGFICVSTIFAWDLNCQNLWLRLEVWLQAPCLNKGLPKGTVKGQSSPLLKAWVFWLSLAFLLALVYQQENKTPGEGRKERGEGRKGKVGY